MPIDPVSLIPIAGTIFNTVSNLFGNQQQNQQNQILAQQQAEWNLQQQQQQQAFDLDMWHLQNQYNSPQSQMDRFKAAGLNPHLIYGKGNPGNAMPLRSPDIKPYKRAEYNSIMNGIDVFGDYYRFKNTEVQWNNTEANTQLAQANATLAMTKNIGEITRNAQSEIELYKAEKLKETQIDKLQVELESQIQDLNKKTRENRIADATEKEATELIRQQLNNLKKQNKSIELKNVVDAYRASLAKMNINPNDPLSARILMKLLEEYKIDLPSIFGGISKFMY
jgi:uncharacterized protein (UPF0305 family)